MFYWKLILMYFLNLTIHVLLLNVKLVGHENALSMLLTIYLQFYGRYS